MSNYIQDQHMMTVEEEFSDLMKRIGSHRKRAEKETNIRMTEFVKEFDPINNTWEPFVIAVDNLKRIEQIVSTLKCLDLYESDMTPIEKRTRSKTKTRKTKSIRRNKPLGVSRKNSVYQTRSIRPQRSSSGMARTLRRTKPPKKRARATTRVRSTNAKRWRAIESNVANKTIPRHRWTEQEVNRLDKASQEADRSLTATEFYKDIYRRFGPTFRTLAGVRKKAYSRSIYLKEE